MERQHNDGEPIYGTPLYRVVMAVRAAQPGDDVEVFVGDLKDVLNASGATGDARTAILDLVKGKTVGMSVMVPADWLTALCDAITDPEEPEEVIAKPKRTRKQSPAASEQSPQSQGEQNASNPEA